MVHSDEHIVSCDCFFQRGWKRIGVGLIRGFHAEVDEWFEERFDLRGGYFGDATLEDEGNAGACCNLTCVRSYGIVVDLNVA